MKFLLSILMVLAMFVNSISAQDKTITTNIAYTVKGGAADTVIKNGTATYAIYANAFCDKIKFGVKQTRVSGTYTKARAIIQTSLDYSNWTAVDTVLFATASASTYGNSDLISPFAPYVRILFKPYDSTQTVKYQYYIVAERK